MTRAGTEEPVARGEWSTMTAMSTEGLKEAAMRNASKSSSANDIVHSPYEKSIGSHHRPDQLARRSQPAKA